MLEDTRRYINCLEFNGRLNIDGKELKYYIGKILNVKDDWMAKAQAEAAKSDETMDDFTDSAKRKCVQYTYLYALALFAIALIFSFPFSSFLLLRIMLFPFPFFILENEPMLAFLKFFEQRRDTFEHTFIIVH